MDPVENIQLDLNSSVPSEGRFLKLLSAVKNLNAAETKLPHQLAPAAVLRKLQVEGFFPIVDYIERLIPYPTIYTSDPGRNAIMNSVGYSLLSGKLSIQMAAPCYKFKDDIFMLGSKTPLFFDLCVAACTTASDYDDNDWLKRLIDNFHRYIQPIHDVYRLLWDEPELKRLRRVS